jgi:hypothetical protein
MIVTITTPEGINRYRARVIARALRLYDKTKMQVNRNYTPTNMLRVASELTGKTFNRGEYVKAAEALEAL